MTTDVAEPTQGERIAEAAITARDLIDQAQQAMGAAHSQGEDNWEIIDASPRRYLWVLYSMINGERVAVPEFVAKEAIKKKVTIRGKTFYAWTADKTKAPTYKVGKVLCFLHPDAPEAELMAELGIPSVCEANELMNLQSKRLHGQRLHKGAWEAWQEYLGLEREKDYREGMKAQTEATLRLAEAAAAKPEAKTPAK